MQHDIFGKDQTLQFKGILCLIVLFGHCNEGPFYSFGPWAVTVFFLISGYVLQLTTEGKKAGLKLFLHKMGNFLLPFIIVSIPYHIMFRFFPSENDYNSVKGAIVNLLKLTPTVQAGWYIVTLSFLFIAFFLAKLIAKEDKKKLLGMMILLYIPYFIYIVFIAKSPWGVYNAHFFIVGMWYRMYRDRIGKFLGRNNILGYVMLLFGYAVIAIPFFFYEQEPVYAQALMILFYNASPILFLYFSYNFKLKSKVLRFFGRYSLWIYLTHVGIQYFLMSALPSFNITVRWTVITFFAATLALSLAVSLVLGTLYEVVRKKITAAKA